MKNSTQRPIRTSVVSWTACAAMSLSLGLPGVAAADDSQAANLEFIIVSDDIRKEVTPVARAAGADGSSPAAPDAGAGADSGKSNNGHGNNADGVDSSNPGQGGGGPNGAEDPSAGVDDEAGGGGASPSKNKNKNE